ncbi:NAD(P)-dependent oxidoreductase [Lunatibacter salilacus]|uniref:NAD(P)-dependent oxidoreductase n=1 Tax=Lunatibacter salilacus TaxID=2483804 RepID=UPI00131CA7C5|nr:NAD(P)-dependent oxidoreductase [Lunatibacter salilacus]
MKIGLIREYKVPADKRVAFSPKQLAHLQMYYENRMEFKVAPSPDRCFTDEEYLAKGIEVSDDLTDCDILMGVKEVPIPELIPDKTYFFFSHTIKKQPYNQQLLQEILHRNIRLIDYEALKDNTGQRVVAFGRWAGLVGAYNGLWTYGQKSGLYTLKRAFECHDLHELMEELRKVELPPIKIVITGDGKVARGVLEIMEAVGIQRVTTDDFLRAYYEEPVFTQLAAADYNQRKTDGGFDLQEFYEFPQQYEGCFTPYTEVSDIFIAAAYWDPLAPVLFKASEISSPDFNISVIADITCDIDGSIPTTIRPTTIADPVYDIDRERFEELPAFGKQNSISVMAIDNLPCELPRDASEDFGRQLSEQVIPEFFVSGSTVIRQATVAENGELTTYFAYLADYVNGQ